MAFEWLTHAVLTKGVDIALAAFGVGKGSAKMADEEVRKIEITYPTAFASAAKAGGARVRAMMTATSADPQSSTKYLRNIGDKEKRAEELEFDWSRRSLRWRKAKGPRLPR